MCLQLLQRQVFGVSVQGKVEEKFQLLQSLEFSQGELFFVPDPHIWAETVQDAAYNSFWIPVNARRLSARGFPMQSDELAEELLKNHLQDFLAATLSDDALCSAAVAATTDVLCSTIAAASLAFVYLAERAVEDGLQASGLYFLLYSSKSEREDLAFSRSPRGAEAKPAIFVREQHAGTHERIRAMAWPWAS